MFLTTVQLIFSPNFNLCTSSLYNKLLSYFQENLVIFLTSGEDKKGMMLLTGPKDQVLQLGPQ